MTSCSLQGLDQFLDFPDFDILISVLCIFTHFEGVVGAGGVVTEVDKPPLTSQALKLKINPKKDPKGFCAMKMHIFVLCWSNTEVQINSSFKSRK